MAATSERYQYFYICIGKPGTGKSPFISAVRGLPIDMDSPDADAQLYTLPNPNQHISMINTPGFRSGILRWPFDPPSPRPSVFSCQTNQSSLFRLLIHNQISSFNGIFWFVNDVSSERELKAQARFIDNLLHEVTGPLDPPESNWDHVAVFHGSSVDTRIIREIIRGVTFPDIDASYHLENIENIMERLRIRQSNTNANNRRRRSSTESIQESRQGVLRLIRSHGYISVSLFFISDLK
jgi:hypothetical protein